MPACLCTASSRRFYGVSRTLVTLLKLSWPVLLCRRFSCTGSGLLLEALAPAQLTVLPPTTCTHLHPTPNRRPSSQDAGLPLVEALMPAVSKLLEKGRFPGGWGHAHGESCCALGPPRWCGNVHLIAQGFPLGCYLRGGWPCA